MNAKHDNTLAARTERIKNRRLGACPQEQQQQLVCETVQHLPDWHTFWNEILDINPEADISEARAAYVALQQLSKQAQRYRAPKPQAADLSVLVHDCFNQQGGETKTDCACQQKISRLDAAALLKAGKADRLVYTRGGKVLFSRTSIVLRRDYVHALRMKRKVDPAKLLPAILKPASRLSFRDGILRAENGSAFVLEVERTDALYWNSVLISLGLGAEAGQFLDEAAEGMGVPVSLTTLENFHLADNKLIHGIDPEVNALIGLTIREAKAGARHRRHRVGAAGFMRGTSGGLTYNENGKIKKAPRVWSVGNGRDSDERAYEAHSTTGQFDSKPDPNYEGNKAGMGTTGASLEDKINPTNDTRYLPTPLLTPEKSHA